MVLDVCRIRIKNLVGVWVRQGGESRRAEIGGERAEEQWERMVFQRDLNGMHHADSPPINGEHRSPLSYPRHSCRGT